MATADSHPRDLGDLEKNYNPIWISAQAKIGCAGRKGVQPKQVRVPKTEAGLPHTENVRMVRLFIRDLSYFERTLLDDPYRKSFSTKEEWEMSKRKWASKSDEEKTYFKDKFSNLQIRNGTVFVTYHQATLSSTSCEYRIKVYALLERQAELREILERS